MVWKRLAIYQVANAAHTPIYSRTCLGACRTLAPSDYRRRVMAGVCLVTRAATPHPSGYKQCMLQVQVRASPGRACWP
jgi:hypothetical protein